MSDTAGKTTLEIIAPTVEEAVEKGLKQLNLPEDSVSIEILDHGNKGLFGLGSRDARVRLVVKPEYITRISEPLQDEFEITDDELDYEYEEDDSFTDDDTFYDEDEDIEEIEYTEDVELSTDEEEIVRLSKSTVEDLLERMHIDADVNATYRHPDTQNERPSVWIDITGNDLSVLIGRRNQTLHALQYITSLIVGKELGRSVPLIIDVEGYRSRREAQLRRLALTMADQAIKTGRTQALEPMPSNERRIIHITLRDYEGVKTESIGDDPFRKVTIIPNNEI